VEILRRDRVPSRMIHHDPLNLLSINEDINEDRYDILLHFLLSQEPGHVWVYELEVPPAAGAHLSL
jgi:hypothetical protein